MVTDLETLGKHLDQEWKDTSVSLGNLAIVSLESELRETSFGPYSKTFQKEVRHVAKSTGAPVDAVANLLRYESLIYMANALLSLPELVRQDKVLSSVRYRENMFGDAKQRELIRGAGKSLVEHFKKP